MMNKLSYKVKWLDKNGDPHSKEYATLKESDKAKAWLKDNGATEIDVIVLLVEPKDTVKGEQKWEE